MCARKESVSEEKKKKRKEDERDCSVACASQKGAARGDSRKGGMNERGSQCTYEGKGAVSGEKEKRKKYKPGGKGAARADSRKRGPPHVCKREGALVHL